MSRVRTGSRLHFGLFHLPPAEPWPEFIPGTKVPPRYFGGIGMMVDKPAVVVESRPAPDWSFAGLHADRLRWIAERLAALYPDMPPHHVEVVRTPHEHQGFGLGTQLSLAVGSSIVPRANADHLARQLERGKRSSIGLWGFTHGGFIVDPGKRFPNEQVIPAAHLKMPEHWQIVLITLPIELAWAGERERSAFISLATARRYDPVLAEIVLNGLIPALQSIDLATFGAALTEYNARAGDLFKSVQGGRYAHADIAALILTLQKYGLVGAGQSSWGPTVFAFTDDPDLAEFVQCDLKSSLPTGTQVLVTHARNCGAEFTQ